MKAYTKTLICIFIAMLFFPTEEVKATDESVRYNMDQLTASHSIIRNYKNNEDIVCFHTASDPTFMMYKSGVTNTYVIYLDPMDTVYDFEIFNDTVYFTGKYKSPYPGNAVVGFFDATSFYNSSATQVTYLYLPSVEKITAIEVARFASRKHVVGVGRKSNLQGIMVDLIEESYGWNVNISDMGGDTINMMDLAIIDDHVVATSIKPLVNPVGRLWFVPKPTTPGASLFPNYVTCWDLISPVGPKYVIKKFYGNRFVTAYGRFSVLGNTYRVSFYNGLSHENTVSIGVSGRIAYPLGDIGINGIWGTVELLVYGNFLSNLSSIVIEVPNLDPVPTTLDAHVYNGVLFESIVWARAFNLNEMYFAAAGYNAASGYGTPYFMRFRESFFEGQCLSESHPSAINFNPGHTTFNVSTNVTTSVVYPNTIRAERKFVRAVTECYSNTPVREDEQETE